MSRGKTGRGYKSTKKKDEVSCTTSGLKDTWYVQ